MLKFKTWLTRYWKVLLSLAVFIGMAGIGWYFYRPVVPENVSRFTLDASTQPEQALTEPAPLTGVEVDPASASEPVLGVMIENSPNARPQSSLGSADIVFEAVTEGGITRFLALYQQNMPRKVGPIRSIRLHYVDWFMGYDAAIAHVGGSGEALQLVSRRKAKSLNQFYHSGPYYRAGDRHAPHNMYSSAGDLRALQKRLGYTGVKIKQIPRSDDSPSTDPSAPKITVDYSSSLYRAQFRYHKASNSYRRYMAGAPHIDRETGSVISIKNVVVMKMPSRQSGQYVLMDTIGTGEGVVFKDGGAKKVTWRQSSPRHRIELIDSGGKEFPLNRGNTWFAVIPRGRPVSY